MRLPALVLAGSIALALHAAPAHAGLNDESCLPSAAHPYPVVLVHGRGGTVLGFGSLIDTLQDAGYCVFGINHGQVGGAGPYGHDHLTVSGDQLDAYLDHVLEVTGADLVDVIGHSAGTGVINNVILEKAGGDRIHRAVAFGGLHHPYAHAGAAQLADAQLFLPNLIAMARLVAPGITAQQVIVDAINLYAGAGGSLAGIDVETATSNFAADLFDPVYWTELHGRLSEPFGDLVQVGNSARTLTTADSVPTICYTNVVGVADLLTGPAAGFQDAAPNVDNFLLVTPADHVQILTDPIAVEKLLESLGTPCPFAPIPDDGGGGGDGDGDSDGGGDGDGDGDGGFESAGCSTGGGTSAGCVLLLLALQLRRRRAA